jgi:MoaA/NifB/PqqE/SkfB family radical SAM enzyme
MRWRAGPSGVHLFDRRTGLNCLFDEVQVSPEKWAAAPRHVAIALTNACDLACAHCYAPKQTAALAPDRVCRWLSELDANGCLGVGFGGGEPTLHRGFADICRYAAQETGLAVSFTTHGHQLFDGRLSAAIAGHVHFVRVSMDGVGRTYEAIRGRPFDAFLRCLGVVRALARFGLNYVVNRRTLPDLDAAAGVAANAGASELLLLPEMPVQGSGGIDPTTRSALACWVAAYRGPVPLSVGVSGAEGLPTCDPLRSESGLQAFSHIDAAGILKASSYDVHGVPIGEGSLMRAVKMLEAQRRGLQ